MKEITWMDWVAALRSGKYKQGRGLLQNNDGEFCCLGVLCDLYYPEGWANTKFHYKIFSLSEDEIVGYVSMAPPELLELVTGEEISSDELINWNDTWLKSFNDIADEIERIMNNV